MRSVLNTGRSRVCPRSQFTPQSAWVLASAFPRREIHLAESSKGTIINGDETDAKREPWWLEDLFERPQISRQTKMPHLTVGTSTRRVENGRSIRLPKQESLKPNRY